MARATQGKRRRVRTQLCRLSEKRPNHSPITQPEPDLAPSPRAVGIATACMVLAATPCMWGPNQSTEACFRFGRSGFVGPIIEVSHSLSNTGQRSHVAEIIARVFPEYMAFATHLMEEGTGEPLKLGPYPKDALTYRSNRMAEYKTPAQTDGLGTHSWLKKNGSPIEGVAILVGPTPDLLLLSVRLPPELNGLTSVIIRQFERDAERSEHH